MLVKTLNIVGILLNIIGVIMVYVNSPVNFHTIQGAGYGDEWNEIVRKTERKNKLLKLGVLLIIAGSILQLISNFF